MATVILNSLSGWLRRAGQAVRQMAVVVCLCGVMGLAGSMEPGSWSGRAAQADVPIINHDHYGDLDLSSFASQLKAILEKKEADAVSLGEFRGPPNFPGSYGPKIQKVLGDALEKVGIIIKLKAAYAIEARYFIDDVQTNLSSGEGHVFTAIRLDISIIDARSGQVVVDLSFPGVPPGKDKKGPVVEQGKYSTHVVDTESVTQIIGVPAAYDPAATPVEKDEKLREYLEEPPVYFQDQRGKPKPKPEEYPTGPTGETRICAGPDSPFAIEILVDGKPRPFHLEHGLPFVDLKADELYEVRVFSAAPFETAVRATVDGISIFEFSKDRKADGSPRFSEYIIGPREDNVIRGWFIDNEHVDAFKITDYADSAAAKVKSTQGLGMITLCFHAAWDAADKNAHPSDEPITKGEQATGFGPPIRQITKPVKRKIGALRASITVRYSK